MRIQVKVEWSPFDGGEDSVVEQACGRGLWKRLLEKTCGECLWNRPVKEANKS